MSIFPVMVSILVMSVALGLSLPECVEVYRRFERGKRVVCPETRADESVATSPILAAASSSFAPFWFHIQDCSQWPEHGC